MNNEILVIDGNEATVDVAYRCNENCIIYPITPSSSMSELADEWSTQGKPNVFGSVPDVIQMQSEAGVAGALHGTLQTGALATTFTSSQGLLLMIPDMYCIAGRLLPTVFHVSTRTVSSHGMSIYCDHSDVMAIRSTGFAMLCSANVQEAHDMALIAQATSFATRIPFLHFFDGFRTSHEVSKIFRISDEQIREMLDQKLILEHRARRMAPENPFVRGVVYDSDVYFQQREAVNKYYFDAPQIFGRCLEKFAKLTGRSYKPIEYFGHEDAEYVIALMGSGAETAYETVDYLQKLGEKVGMLKVRLFQPFPSELLIQELPKSCKVLIVLDRCKESGAVGEPLYQAIATSVMEYFGNGGFKNMPKVIGGRFGIGSKEFTPAMVKAVFDEAKKDGKRS